MSIHLKTLIAFTQVRSPNSHRDGQRRGGIDLLAVLLIIFGISTFEFWEIVHLCFRSIQIVLVNDVNIPYAQSK